MSMNYTFLSPSNFSCLSLPKLKNFPDSVLASMTNTKPLFAAPPPQSQLRNPIVLLTTGKGFICIWGYKSRLSRVKISFKGNLLKCSKVFSIKVLSSVLALTSASLSKSSLLLVQTRTAYFAMTPELKIVWSHEAEIIEINLNPYCPTEHALLTETFLQVSNRPDCTFPCEGFLGFDYQFSPFIFTLYNSSAVYLKDIREPSIVPVYSTSDIKQVLPIDCCYSHAILTDEVELIDCRYWVPYKKYRHVTPGSSWKMFTVPQRTMMYTKDCLKELHQSLYCISETIEKIPHGKEDPLTQVFMSLTPGCEDAGKLQPSLAFSTVHAALPAMIGDKEHWVLVCAAGGLYVENANESIGISQVSEKSRVAYKRKLGSVNKIDRKEFLETLVNEDLKVPFCSKPQPPFEFEPVFEDFEDDN